MFRFYCRRNVFVKVLWVFGKSSVLIRTFTAILQFVLYHHLCHLCHLSNKELHLLKLLLNVSDKHQKKNLKSVESSKTRCFLKLLLWFYGWRALDPDQKLIHFLQLRNVQL